MVVTILYSSILTLHPTNSANFTTQPRLCTLKMLFSKHSKTISKKHFADLALSIDKDEVEAGSRTWALAHVNSFKYQLLRLERSIAIVNDDIFWLGVDVNAG